MLLHYLRLSLKVLLRRKFFTFISIVGISLTLLVLMVATAIMDNSWAPMPPETHQDRMLVSAQAMAYGDQPDGGMSAWCCSAGFALFDRYARNLPGVAHLSVYKDDRQVDSYVDGGKVSSHLKRTDGEYWKILEFTFLEGRPYTTEEVEQAAFVAVINRASRERFFGDSRAEGKTLEAGGQRFRVVGVVENVPFLREVPFADIWTPYTTEKVRERPELMGDFQAMVLAAPGASLDEIRREFNARLARIDPAQLPGDGFTTIVAPFETKFNAFARDGMPFTDYTDPEPQGWRLIATFSGIAILFVLLPTVNLVNINISRIMERSAEIGIRKAFGASSRTLVGQFIVENVVLTLAGGLLGLLLSAFTLEAVNRSGTIPYAQLGLNVRVFLYGMVMTTAFGIISGVYPAWRMSRLHPADALRGGRR